jgi:hypothetical protein
VENWGLAERPGVEGLARDIRCPFEALRGHRSRSQEEQRMQDDLTRLVGLEGFEVKRVVEEGGQWPS